MARAHRRASGWCQGWAWLVVVLGAGGLRAEEPVTGFLAALRENQYNEEALQYLDRVEADSRTPAAFRTEIPYQRGVTLIQAAQQVRDLRARETLLNSARENLNRFLQEQPEHPKRSSARHTFGIVLREWARMKVEQASRTDDAALRKEAAGLYDEAYKVFDGAVTELKTELQALQEQPKGMGDEPDRDQLRLLRFAYLDSMLRRAETFEDKAQTEPAGSGEQKKLLDEAVRLYGEMYAKYSGYPLGMQARLNEARILVKAGELDKALKFTQEDVVDQWASEPPKERVSRDLVTQAFLLAMDCWLHESKKQYADSIARVSPWIAQIHPDEETDPNWIALKLQLAKANQAHAEALQAQNPRDPQIAAARDEARRLARQVARAPGGRQDEARELLASIPGGVVGAKVEEKPAATTFEEAKNYAIDAIAEMQSQQYLLDEGPGRLANETDEKYKNELREELAQAEQAVTTSRAAALENLILAMGLADAQTSIEDLNLVRRLRAYLHLTQDEFYEAAVLAEFVARKFPASEWARNCSLIALSAYAKLYEASESETKEFESQHIISVAQFIVQTWSGTPEAADAINTLIPFLIRRGEMDKAREYVDTIPVDSPQRAPAELRIGESLWRDYLTGMEQVRQWEREAQEAGAPVDELKANIARRKPELDGLKQTALNVLETGVDRMRKSGTIDATIPPAVLALAQIYVTTDQAPKALALLDDETIGVLPMVQRKDPAVDTATMREHVYRVALSAVVSALPKVTGAEERTELIERSQQLMEALRKEVGETPEAEQRLVAIFYSLARGLETQIKLLDKPEDRRLLTDGFSAFLSQVQSKSTDLRVLNWVAESYAGLGSGLANDTSSTDAAHACFVKAVETYDHILKNAESLGLTPELRRHVQIRQALAHRSAGNYEAAIQAFTAVLGKEGTKVDLQVEAAKTFQEWAGEPRQALKYKSALFGGEWDPVAQKNIIWGWNRIAQATERLPDFRELYHEARYNAASCYYAYALKMRSAPDREKYLKIAQESIVLMYRLNPKMGGKAWYAKYNALYKKIQTALQESPTGLAGLASQPKAS